MSAAPSVVRVDLGKRGYDIVVGRGVIAEAGARIAHLRPGANVAIVSDTTVFSHHGAALRSSLSKAGITAHEVLVAPGEASKSWRMLERVSEGLISARIERRDLVIALGGGVVGDLAGCAAALTRRGTDVVQIPTSLLAQVDSSVGGKTGINSPAGKNLIGAFHQPCLVLADSDALDTLSARHMRAGYAEIVKYGLLGDGAFYNWLEAHWQGIFSGGAARIHAISKSCAMKAAIVARDETEQGERALLNLGHTFAHALEALTGYSDRLLHGEAVSIGMALAFRYSARSGLVAPAAADRIERHLRAVGLPTRIGDIAGGVGGSGDIMAAMAQDKKVSRGRLTFILVKDIGAAFIARDVEGEAMVRFLDSEMQEMVKASLP